jgi:transcriptional regulator with PAS, ATPase and Fis domain
MTDELLDAELFGHARGAFTGAIAERRGLFEEADGGTLVLDEVSELSPRAQAKLLRAIQEGEVRRVGENLPRVVDTRIVAASNRPLRAAAEGGTFRRDLLYRLEVIRIVVPPLRERVDDIPLLAAHFWEQATARLGSRATLAPASVAALARYDWPGNVRELQNVMAALAVSTGRRGSVGPERLPSAIARVAASVRSATLDEARRLFEARYVKAALARAGGQRAQAARELGLTRQGLAKLLARLEIA